MYVCMPAYLHTYILTCVHTYIYIHTYIHTYIRMYKHTYVHTYIRTYIRTYIHTHTHTHTHMLACLIGPNEFPRCQSVSLSSLLVINCIKLLNMEINVNCALLSQFLPHRDLLHYKDQSKLLFRKIIDIHFDNRRNDIAYVQSVHQTHRCTRYGRRYNPHVATTGIPILLPAVTAVDISILEYALVLRLLQYWFACRIRLVLNITMTVSIYGVQLLLQINGFHMTSEYRIDELILLAVVAVNVKLCVNDCIDFIMI
jgi:hypothetical protein